VGGYIRLRVGSLLLAYGWPIFGNTKGGGGTRGGGGAYGQRGTRGLAYGWPMGGQARARGLVGRGDP
jgi:hypothetical protein